MYSRVIVSAFFEVFGQFDMSQLLQTHRYFVLGSGSGACLEKSKMEAPASHCFLDLI
jgi:hypothetical protein